MRLMTNEDMENETASNLSAEERKEKIRSQLEPAGKAFVADIEKRLASGLMDNSDLDQLIASLERLSDPSRSR